MNFFHMAVVALATGRPPFSARAGQPKPKDAGFSPERLKRLTDALEADVNKGAIPGAVVLVQRQGKVVLLHTVGYRDREAQAPMKVDSIFRLASMTKPIVTVGAMMLVEEGKLDLVEPVSQYLPELKGMKVGVETIEAGQEKPTLALEPVLREMTVQDLMRHTSGLTYGPFGNSLVQQAWVAADLLNFEQTNAEMIGKLAKLPLAYQPGTTFEYSMSVDVLGRVIEVVSGLDLETCIRERVAEPLGMPDTHFVIAPKDSDRIAEPQIDPATGKRPFLAPFISPQPKWFMGGGGMYSTAADYGRFCQMLLNGGELDGVRLLSPKTVALMTSDHLPPGVKFGPYMGTLGITAPMPAMGQGFGLGFAVRTEAGRNPLPGSVGDFHWAGTSGTYFWVDPKEELFAVLMLQAPLERIHYRSIMRELVYQALVK